MLHLGKHSLQSPSFAVQRAPAFHLQNVAVLAETTENSLGTETRRRQLPAGTCQAQAHCCVFMDTSVGLGSGRTQNCHGGEAECLAECIGETEIASAGAQLLPGCSDLAIAAVLNIRHAHRRPRTLVFQTDRECRLS